jgi:PAS domain S-box-containing protein
LRGIVGIELPLTTLVGTIVEASSLEQQGDGQVLFSFLLGSSGEIIAFPIEFLSLFGLAPLPEKMKHSRDMLDYNLGQSTNPQVQKMVARILAQESGVETVLLGEENHLVASQTLSVHGWKLIMVAREADLILSGEKTWQALDKMIVSFKTCFVFYSLCITLILLCLAYLAVRYFVAPLKKLALLAERVGAGDLSQKSDLIRGDELGVLATGMNTMIDGLVSAETMKKQYFQSLENGIKTKTAELQKNNQKLSTMVRDVHLESEKNRKLSNALRERERQLIATMEASLAGLCIVQGNRFKYVNAAIVKMFGYSKIELINRMGPIDLIAPEYKVEVMERMSLQEERLYRRPDQPHHVKCLRKNGEVFDVEVDGSYIPWKGVPASVGTMVDISEHVRVQKRILVKENRLQGLLQEKDLLLREVYHRTKNNMLVIISMLALQMEDIEDKAAKKIFEEMEHRIRAMALVHENLYQSENLVEINLGEYLAKLARTQVEHMTFSDQIEVRADYCQVTVPFDKAVPLGLVVSELITNSVKHAFPSGKKGIIHIQLAVKKGVFYLVVEDNGTGLPTEIDIENATSFGLQITSSMVVKQLGGTLAIDRSRGTAFHITFKDRT